MITTKYLYLSKGRNYGKIQARISANKSDCKKQEICIKLNLDVDDKAFTESLPVATITVPKDFKNHNINLRMG